MNYTTEDLKAEEFLTKCYELSDTIFHSKTEKTVTITSYQLQFYGKTITEVMQMFSSFLEQLQGPDHPEDPGHWSWKVWATRTNSEQYKLTFRQRLDLTVEPNS